MATASDGREAEAPFLDEYVHLVRRSGTAGNDLYGRRLGGCARAM